MSRKVWSVRETCREMLQHAEAAAINYFRSDTPDRLFGNSRAPLSVDLRAPCSSKTRLFNCEKVGRVDFMLVITDQMFYFVK